MNNNNAFYNIDNLKLIVNIFNDYMSETFSLKLDGEDEVYTRKLLFELIGKVNDDKRNNNISLQEKNIKVMNIAKDIYIKRYNLSYKNNKPNIQNLARDKSIFGNRKMQTSALVPDIDPYNRKGVEIKEILMDRLITDRDRDIGIEKKVLPNVDKVINPTLDKAENVEEFMRKLEEFENQRNIVIDDIEIRRPKAVNDDTLSSSVASSVSVPFPIQESIMINRNLVSKEINDMNINYDPKAIMTKIQTHEALVPIPNIYSKFSAGNEQMVIPKNDILKNVEKYLCINSFDRDWLIEPLRYKYSVNFMSKSNSIQNRYRNIESISVSKVIIPDEIFQTDNSNKEAFNYEFTFSYPYLILLIDEFNDIYDGTNDIVRKAFCTLAFDTVYRGQNGRGYIVLKPMQNEKKIFYPALLSSLNKLSISLLKPNGSLFNTSTDSYNILSLEYDPGYRNLLKITTNVYFDKNEFYIADKVLFTNYIMTKLTNDQQDSDINSFNNYINNPEGFEIINLASMNANGFYNIFYIYAPGAFNKSIGQYELNSNLITCLNNYNSNLVTKEINGNIMNFSLQHSISMKLNIIVDDARILDTQSTFNF